MIGSLHLETRLAAAYVLFLLLVAAALEWFGRYSQRRSGQFRTAGFRYHHQLDLWECPSGHHLHRHRAHPEDRFARYRASAHTCNACSLKVHCTDSHQGREIVQTSVPWHESEAGRFHRGMSLVLFVLAAFILAVEMFRIQTGTDRAVLGSGLALVAALGMRRFRERFSRAAPSHQGASQPRSTSWMGIPGVSWAARQVIVKRRRPSADDA